MLLFANTGSNDSGKHGEGEDHGVCLSLYMYFPIPPVLLEQNISPKNRIPTTERSLTDF